MGDHRLALAPPHVSQHLLGFSQNEPLKDESDAFWHARGQSCNANAFGSPTGYSRATAAKRWPQQHPALSGFGGTGAALNKAKSPAGKQKGKGTGGHDSEARGKEEGRRKIMRLRDNVVIWSFQITSAFYIVTKW